MAWLAPCLVGLCFATAFRLISPVPVLLLLLLLQVCCTAWLALYLAALCTSAISRAGTTLRC
jgi:hypothetical protein